MKSVLAAAGFGALLFLAILAIGHMSRRTKQSVRLLGRILGLKTFIQAAEMDRINQLAEDDPSYFYHVLPYAYVMGLSDTWMKHFETIPIAYPDWYDNGSGEVLFHGWIFSNMMRNCSHAVTSHIHIDTEGGDIGGGSFHGGGGGFSGGGFGGGGGGAW